VPVSIEQWQIPARYKDVSHYLLAECDLSAWLQTLLGHEGSRLAEAIVKRVCTRALRVSCSSLGRRRVLSTRGLKT
jgi:hypothetical protein